MLAAWCLDFFGFLLVSEFMIPSNTCYDNKCHLSLTVVSVDDLHNPQPYRIKIKWL